MLSEMYSLVDGAKSYLILSPKSGCLPVMMSTNIDLPPPLGPVIAMFSPSRSSKFTG